MTFEHRCSCTGCADDKICGRNITLPQHAQNFARFLLDFFLFAGDERNNVIKDIKPDNTRGTSSSRQSLHGSHDDLLKAKVIEQGLQGNCQADGSAVWLGRDKSLPATVFLLNVKKLNVIQVHAWDENWYVLFVTEGRSRAHDWSGFSVERFEFTCRFWFNR